MGLPQEVQSPDAQNSLELKSTKAKEAATDDNQDVEASTKKSHKTR